MTQTDQAALPVTPEAPATQADIDRWFVIVPQLAALKEEEMKLRKKISSTYVQNPVEGVNKVPMTEGWVMKMTYKINRKVLEEALNIITPELKEAKVPIKDLITYKPELSISVYKKLTDEQRLLVDKALEIKPGAPDLEIVKPKRV